MKSSGHLNKRSGVCSNYGPYHGFIDVYQLRRGHWLALCFAVNGHADVKLQAYLIFVRQVAMPFNQFTQLSNFLLTALAGAERGFCSYEMAPRLTRARLTWCALVAKESGEESWAWVKTVWRESSCRRRSL